MTRPILVALLVLVALGPALLAYILTRRHRGLPFWRCYRAMLPGFLASGILKAGYHLTGWFSLELAAPVVMVVGVLLAVRRLER
jgi:hypothetical protein